MGSERSQAALAEIYNYAAQFSDAKITKMRHVESSDLRYFLTGDGATVQLEARQEIRIDFAFAPPEAERVEVSLGGGGAGELFEWFDSRRETTDADRFTVDALVTPDLQASFIRLEQHEEFFRRIDPTKSYCFRAVEKVGKGSWLGCLAAARMADRDGGRILPLWLRSAPEGGQVAQYLQSALESLRRARPGYKPLLLIDNLDQLPALIAPLAEIKPWLDSCGIPVYSTYAADAPELAIQKSKWLASEDQWDVVTKVFCVEGGVPQHPVTSASDGTLTEDGRRLLRTVDERCGSDIAALLRPIFAGPSSVVSLYFLSAFIVENAGKSLGEHAAWLAVRSTDWRPSALFRKGWEGSELHQDVLRTVSYLENATRDLAEQFCRAIREEEDGAPVEQQFTRQIRVQRVREVVDKVPFGQNDLQRLTVLDGLRATALSPENFSMATERRYWLTLKQLVRPGVESGELAALIAFRHTNDSPERRRQLLERMSSETLSDAQCAYLYVLGRLAFAEREIVSSELGGAITRALSNRVPSSSRDAYLLVAVQCAAVWAPSPGDSELAAGMLGLLAKCYGDERHRLAASMAIIALALRKGWRNALRALLECVAAEGEIIERIEALILLERDLAAEALLADPGVDVDDLTAVANFYEAREAWAAAVPLWHRIAAQSTEHRVTAQAREVECLLRLERDAEAEVLLADPGVDVGVLLAAANAYAVREAWAAALPLCHRIAAQSVEHRALAQAHEVECLLRLERDAEAEVLLADPGVDVGVLVAAVNAYAVREAWAAVLPLCHRIAAQTVEHRALAQAHEVECLLRLERDAEAEVLLAHPDVDLGVLVAAVAAYEAREAWAAAVPLWHRIAAQSAEHPAAALAHEVACLLRLERDAEAEVLFAASDVALEVLFAAAETYEARAAWATALAVWHRIAAQSVEHRTLAQAHEVVCLIRLERDAEAEVWLAAPDADVSVLVVSADAYEARAAWGAALPLWHRIAAQSAKHRAPARAHQVACLIRVERDAEAEAMLAAPDVDVNGLILAADAYEARAAWGAALALWHRIAAQSMEHRTLARAQQVACLIRLERDAEAEVWLATPDADVAVLVFAAHAYEARAAWGAALPLWHRIAAQSAEHRAAARTHQVGCLLRLERDAEAEAMLAAPDVDVNGLIIAANVYEQREAWVAAVPLWHRIAAQSEKERALARANEAVCLLRLGRDAEADELLAAPDVDENVLVFAANLCEAREAWATALTLHRRIAARSEERRPAARAHEVVCLLLLQRDAEAEILLAAPDVDVRVLIVAANAYEEREAWAAALQLHQRIAAQSEEDRPAALARATDCLEKLGSAS